MAVTMCSAVKERTVSTFLRLSHMISIQCAVMTNYPGYINDKKQLWLKKRAFLGKRTLSKVIRRLSALFGTCRWMVLQLSVGRFLLAVENVSLNNLCSTLLNSLDSCPIHLSCKTMDFLLFSLIIILQCYYTLYPLTSIGPLFIVYITSQTPPSGRQTADCNAAGSEPMTKKEYSM